MWEKLPVNHKRFLHRIENNLLYIGKIICPAKHQWKSQNKKIVQNY